MSESLTPGILIAMPSLKDPYFEKTVILLCNYTLESAFGLVINTPSSIKIKDVLESQEESKTDLNVSLLVGGPVQPESMWAIHSPDFICTSTSHISPEICISSIHDVLGALIKGTGPGIFHMGCGYSGWGHEQLDREIQEGAWWLTALNTNLVLNMPYTERWTSAITSIGLDPFTASFMKDGEV